MAEAQGIRIQGEGFVLRPWRADDARWLVRNANDAEVARMLGDRFPHPYRREDAWRFLAGEVVDLENPVLAIEVDGRACGSVGAEPMTGERAGSAHFGYWLGRRHWGRGLMTGVVGLFVPWLMAELDLHRVHTTVLDVNLASARVLEKNGFQEEGVQRSAIRRDGRLHDLRMFALTRPPA